MTRAAGRWEENTGNCVEVEIANIVRNYYFPIPGDVQDQAGWRFEQCGLVGGALVHGKGNKMTSKVPSNSIQSMILRLGKRGCTESLKKLFPLATTSCLLNFFLSVLAVTIRNFGLL